MFFKSNLYGKYAAAAALSDAQEDHSSWPDSRVAAVSMEYISVPINQSSQMGCAKNHHWIPPLKKKRKQTKETHSFPRFDGQDDCVT